MCSLHILAFLVMTLGPCVWLFPMAHDGSDESHFYMEAVKMHMLFFISLFSSLEGHVSTGQRRRIEKGLLTCTTHLVSEK